MRFDQQRLVLPGLQQHVGEALGSAHHKALELRPRVEIHTRDGLAARLHDRAERFLHDRFPQQSARVRYEQSGDLSVALGDVALAVGPPGDATHQFQVRLVADGDGGERDLVGSELFDQLLKAAPGRRLDLGRLEDPSFPSGDFLARLANERHGLFAG